MSIGLGLVAGVLYTTDQVSTTLRNKFGAEIIPIASHGDLIGELFIRSYGKGGTNKEMWDGRPHFRDNTSSHYIKITFQDEPLAYEGVAEKWSGRNSNPQVYLSPACEIVDGTASPIYGPGIWVNLDGVRQIQFIEDVCSPCASKIEEIAGKTPSEKCKYTN